MPEHDSVPICQHIKANGERCGSPAITGRHFCHFHAEMRDRAHRRAQAAENDSRFPILEDANAVQIALMQTIDDILHNRIDRKQAALILYALQTASINLRHTDFEPMGLWHDD